MKHVEFHSDNKFEILVHLTGFIVKNFPQVVALESSLTWPQNLANIRYAQKTRNSWRSVSFSRTHLAPLCVQRVKGRVITLHYITLHYIILHYITLHYITLHYITLHYITLHYITLHYIALLRALSSFYCFLQNPLKPKSYLLAE